MGLTTVARNVTLITTVIDSVVCHLHERKRLTATNPLAY